MIDAGPSMPIVSGSNATTILAGVDESKHSADALALATALAPCLDADAVAAYVHPTGDFEPATGDDARLRELADSVLAHLLELGTPVDARRLRLIADRSAARGLQRAAEREGALLITLGASQRSPMGRVVLGSTAERLMSGSPCPVGVAPSGYADETRSIATIGCAFDGSPEARAALDWAAAMAGRSGGRVRILAVHEPLASPTPAFQGVPTIAQDEAARDDLSRQTKAAALDLRRAEVGVDASLLTGRAVPVLEEQSSELDLLVTGSRGYGPARAVLLGSVSGALVRRAACPVVVVPRGADVEDSG
jgi:nucleotide-binding universal stress UspA family protein